MPVSPLRPMRRAGEALRRVRQRAHLHLQQSQGATRVLKRSVALVPLVFAGACSSVDVLNALSSASAHTARTDIAFGPLPRHRLDIYQPVSGVQVPGETPTSAAQPLSTGTPSNPIRPVVVFFYGGSWNRGERKDYAFIGHSLASRGYITVIPDYRLYPDVRYPDFLKDNARAIAWVHANIRAHGGDPQQVFVMGHSAGAYNAAMVALDDRWLSEYQLSPRMLRGFIGISGAYNFLPIGTPDVQPVFFHPNYPKDSQPIDFVSGQSPASFLATSPEDDLINPKRNTLALADRLKQAQIPTVLKTYPTVDHISIIASVAWPLRFKSPLLQDIDDFLQQQLREPVKNTKLELNTLSNSNE